MTEAPTMRHPPSADDQSHRRVLADFYSAVPYPWKPMRLDRIEDPGFRSRFVCQDVGDYEHVRVPATARIWVAGCGTNQALITALQHPAATVLGSDLSEASLAICADNARELGVTNLELRPEAIDEVPYQDEFDLVKCTGVIHHNRRPERLLDRLAGALRPRGVLELMVYNTFHRREPLAFQEAVSRLFGAGSRDNLEELVRGARRLAESIRCDNTLTRDLRANADVPDEEFADLWLNPYERNYTVETLWAMAQTCGLEIEAPCQTMYEYDRAGWEMSFADPVMSGRYAALDDRARWHITNLLLAEQSPRTWFYLGRSVGTEPRIDEAERDRRFLAAVFRPAETTMRSWRLDRTDGYTPIDATARLPRSGPGGHLADIWEAADGRRTMSELLSAGGRHPDPAFVRQARIGLTTTASPYLEAVRRG